MINLVNSVMYDLALVVWFGYALAPASARDAAANHLQTQRWERSLADIQTAAAPSTVPVDSLIPMFEGMVERAFSRSSHLGDEDERASAARAGSKSGN
jgi:hypothetical protein